MQHEQKASVGPMNGTGAESSPKAQPWAMRSGNRVPPASQCPTRSWMRSHCFAPRLLQEAFAFPLWSTFLGGQLHKKLPSKKKKKKHQTILTRWFNSSSRWLPTQQPPENPPTSDLHPLAGGKHTTSSAETGDQTPGAAGTSRGFLQLQRSLDSTQGG